MSLPSEEKTRIEIFDGTKPGEYRDWKRRAQLMIAGLHSTVSDRKYEPRLMEFIKGEAETLKVSPWKISQRGGSTSEFGRS